MLWFCKYTTGVDDLWQTLRTDNGSTAYCWGNFAGPFVVKPSEAPHFTGATIGLLVGYSIKLACHLGLLGTFSDFSSKKNYRVLTATVYMFLMNRHRDKKYGPSNKEASDEAGMRDHTEFQNKDFRYVL